MVERDMMQTERVTLRQVIEAAAEASYEARRIKTGSKPWHERSSDDRRRYTEAIAGAFDYLTTIGYAVRPAGQTGAIPGLVTLSIEDARALQGALTRADVPREDLLRAYTALQTALADSTPAAAPELSPE